ncbi:MAG: hypothetical protein RL522_1729 [Pseudomonadota bacterium]|jgi:hypothetical protein
MHTRSISLEGFVREDGLWDIEVRLVDTKPFPQRLYERGELPPGTPIHDISLRVTVDEALVIREICGATDSTPLNECGQARPPLQHLVGVTLGPGLRQAIERVLGGTRGCTHMREMLANAATAAYQCIPHGRQYLRRAAGIPEEPVGDKPPFHVGRCIAWDVDGPVVARVFPQFAGWAPLRRVNKREV